MLHSLLTGNIFEGKTPLKTAPSKVVKDTLFPSEQSIPQTSSLITSWRSSTAPNTTHNGAGKSCTKIEASIFHSLCPRYDRSSKRELYVFPCLGGAASLGLVGGLGGIHNKTYIPTVRCTFPLESCYCDKVYHASSRYMSSNQAWRVVNRWYRVHKNAF